MSRPSRFPPQFQHRRPPIHNEPDPGTRSRISTERLDLGGGLHKGIRLSRPRMSLASVARTASSACIRAATQEHVRRPNSHRKDG
eukprot:10183719-Karenia_brevis.AAC.1